MDMETEKIYYENPLQREFTAWVTACRPCGESWEVTLDRTCFYPEGGGQPADQGSLGEALVLDVQEREDGLWHLTDKPLPVGEVVTGILDWNRRFDLMQQHSGEHIVSGLVHRTYGYDNVGFHMGSDVITIDFNGMLSPAQLEEIEDRANAVVWEDQKVRVWFPEKEELAALDYRSKKALEGAVRIVEFPGADTCACCGTHVVRTGQIGQIRILSVVKFHEGVRVEMICGGRVQAYLRQVDGQNRKISALLSAKLEETALAVERLKEESFGLRGRLHEQEELYFQSEAARIQGAGDVVIFYPEMEADSLRRLTDALMHACGGRCCAFSRNPEGGYKYAMGQEKGDLRDLVKRMNAALGGRGGGKPFFVQGQVQAEKEQIQEWFSDEKSGREGDA